MQIESLYTAEARARAAIEKKLADSAALTAQDLLGKLYNVWVEKPVRFDFLSLTPVAVKPSVSYRGAIAVAVGKTECDLSKFRQALEHQVETFGFDAFVFVEINNTPSETLIWGVLDLPVCVILQTGYVDLRYTLPTNALPLL